MRLRLGDMRTARLKQETRWSDKFACYYGLRSRSAASAIVVVAVLAASQVVVVHMADIESCCKSTAIQRAVATADRGAPLHMMLHAWFQLQPIRNSLVTTVGGLHDSPQDTRMDGGVLAVQTQRDGLHPVQVVTAAQHADAYACSAHAGNWIDLNGACTHHCATIRSTVDLLDHASAHF